MVKLAAEPLQIVEVVVATAIVGTVVALTFIVILFEVAAFVVVQAAFDVITQAIISLLTKLVLEYVALFTPTFAPFNFHWNVGFEPPFVAVAVNKTALFAQIVLLFVAIETEGVTTGLMVIYVLVEVAVFGLAHVLPDVIIQ